MPTQLICGSTIAYEEHGAGTPLCLLHGFPHDRGIWSSVVPSLGTHARVIVPDLPGFGESATAEDFTIASLARDVHGLLASIDALPCVLGGLSMGGYVAQAFAGVHEKELRGLILLDTRAEADTPDARAGRDKMIELVRREGSAAVATHMLPKQLAPANLTSPVAGELRRIMEACDARTIEHALVALRDRPDFTALLPRLTCPVQVIVGREDALTGPAVAEKMRAVIPHARLNVIDDAGHLAPMEQPDRVAGVIAEFVRGL